MNSDHHLATVLPDNFFLTAAEVAKAFRVSEETVRRWADKWHDSGGQEGLAGVKVGRQWRFDRKDVASYLTSQIQTR